MIKYVEPFHYLTQDRVEGLPLTEQVRMACEAGLKWIQFRCLPRNDAQWIPELNQAAAYCDDWGATLIVNDRPDLLDKADIQGVHVGGGDMDAKKARRLIGPDKVLGGSALNMEDVLYFHHAGADYISIGPYAYTTTKMITQSPQGLAGLEDLINTIHEEIPGFSTPLIVAGGIGLQDVEPLFHLNIHGLAISSAINMNGQPEVMMKEFYSEIKRCRRTTL